MMLALTVLSPRLCTRHRKTAVCPGLTLTFVEVDLNDGFDVLPYDLRLSLSSPPTRETINASSSATAEIARVVVLVTSDHVI